MQLLPRYLVKNRIDIVADLAGFTTEFTPVYKRQALVYKGIDNVLEFRLLNADQRPINTQGYTPKFRAYDSNNTLVVEREGTVLDDGSTATKGLFTVTVTENDLLNLTDEFLKYSIFLIDDDTEDRILTYTDTHFGADAVIRISSDMFPPPKASKSITTFYDDGLTYITSAIDSDPSLNNNEALHTAAIYTSGYVGTVSVEATLENQVSGTTDWATIASLTFDGTETEPTPVNFTGVFSFIRFRTSANPSTISKILVRN
jgi:hypothetical protein